MRRRIIKRKAPTLVKMKLHRGTRHSGVQPDVEKDAERANNSENKVTQRDRSGVQPDVENDEEGNFHRLTSMEKSNPDRDTVDINCESKVNSPMEKNNHGGESDCKNKVDSPYQLRERPLTLTYKYTRNRKASQQFTCTHKGCEKVPPFKNFTELIVHTEVEHSDDEDDINHGNVFPCKHKNCTILAPFKDFSDLIAHTETEHSDTKDEDEESDGLKGTNQEPEILDLTNHKGGTETELLKENQMANARRDRNKAISSAEKRIVQDAWENFKRNSTAEAESQRYLEGSNGHMCPVCNRVFERKNERNLHMKLHNQMVNMCIHRACGWTFQRYHELQWHYSTHHRSSATAKESKNPKLRNKIGSPLSPGLEIAGNDSHPFDQSIDVHSGNETSPEGGETPSFNTNGIRGEHADIQVVASTPVTNLVGNDFTCLRCKRVFKYRKGFLSHVRNHDSMKYKCMESGCGWEFIDFSQVKNHYFQKHNLDIFFDVRYNYKILSDAQKRCPICSRQLLTTSPHQFLTYDYHVQNHDKMMFKCLHQSCGWMFENILHIRGHYKVYHKQDTMDNEEAKYLMRDTNSNAEEKEQRSDSPKTRHEAVVDVIKCEEESDEVEFLSEVIDCTEPGDNSETSLHYSVQNCESAQRGTIVRSYDQGEKNGHQLQMHSKKTNKNVTSKSTKKYSKTHINHHSRFKYRCLRKKCVSMFKTFQQLKIHYQDVHGEIIQQLQRKKFLCRIKGHVSRESEKRQNNCRESTMIRKRHADKELSFLTRKKRRMSGQCTPETFTLHKESRKSLSVIKHNRKLLGLNLKDEAGAYRTRMICPHCTRELPRHVFKDHIKNHATLRFRCSYARCKWMFANYSQLKGHYHYEHHSKVPKKLQTGVGNRFQSPTCTVMQCPKCQRHLHRNQYDKHLLNHYQMAYRCSRANCGWLFESESKLIAHCENHPDMRYKCIYAKCGWMFETSNQLSGHYYYKHKPISEVEASQHRIHSEYLVNSTREQRTTPAVNRTSHVRPHSEKACSTQSTSLRERKRRRTSLLETKSTQTQKTMTKESRSSSSHVNDAETNDGKLQNIWKAHLNVVSSVRSLGNATLNRSLAEKNNSPTCSRLSTNQLNRTVTSEDLVSSDKGNSESESAVIGSNAMGMNVLGAVTYLRLKDLSHCTTGSQATPVKMELKEEPPVETESDDDFFQRS